MIPIGMKYTAKLRGRSPKLVCCEECRLEYVYFVEASSEACRSSWLFLNNKGAAKSARKDAENELQRKLQTMIDVVPCPQCGHVQEHMQALARKRRFVSSLGLAKMGFFVGPFFVLCSFGAFVGYKEDGKIGPLVMGIIMGTLGLGGFVWGLIRWPQVARQRRAYDPNSVDRDIRIERGRELAIPKERLLQEMQKEQAEEYDDDDD